MSGEFEGKIRTDKASRRQWLRGGGAIAAAAVGTTAIDGAAQASEAVPADPSRVTYRETDHIRAFYRRSRI